MRILSLLSIASRAVVPLAFGAAVGLFGACSETIDEANFAIKSEQTASELLASQSQFSMISAIYDRVKLGRHEASSSLTSVLASRGNYTIFAPDNDAVQAYLDDIGVATVADLDEEQAKTIALNSVIDNGNESAYESADFPVPGSFRYSNLNDRTLTCAQDSTGMGYVINGTSQVTQADIEVSNGVIHRVATVIAPSADNVADRLAAADNMRLFSLLLTATTWADSLTAYRDKAYDAMNYEELSSYKLATETSTQFYQNTTRYIGYTVFAEPDSVYRAQWGIDFATDAEGNILDPDAVLRQVQEHCAVAYGTAHADDLTHPDNAINRFVAYHLLYGKIAYDAFVRHCNEFNYRYGNILHPQTQNMPTNVWDYFCTMGRHRGLVKVTQVGDAGFEHDMDHHIYVNRFSIHDNSRTGDYHEVGVRDPGLRISPDNGAFDNNALNGFYFPIDRIMLYDDATRNLLASERQRIEVCTMMPELITNGVRGVGRYMIFAKGYIDNVINESQGTEFLYVIDRYGSSWSSYQGDAIHACGLYDFTLRLMPVPRNGTYEIRMGTSHNSWRGMVQMYFGADPMRLTPAGLPYDMRQQVSETNVAIPWVADTDDEAVNAENDKNLRNQGYMKGPNYFTVTNGTGELPVRTRGGVYACMRRIITTQYMEADKVYYLRFKSVLKKLDSQFAFDYLEIVPTSVYNGSVPEDVW